VKSKLTAVILRRELLRASKDGNSAAVVLRDAASRLPRVNAKFIPGMTDID
jgi:hypothetical protein